MSHHRLLIIGSGPAGYTAGVYAARAQLAPIILAGERAGGQLMWTTDIENFPGFPKGKSGQELMADMQAQAERFGSVVKTEYATAVDFSQRPFRVWNTMPVGVSADDVFSGTRTKDYEALRADIVAMEPAYTADAVILAVGATSIMLGVPGEQEFFGRGVSTCAVCDAAFYRDKTTVVVGGGDSAMEDTLALTKFARSVTVIHRREEFKASKIMRERVLNHPKVKVLWNSQVTAVNGTQAVESVTVSTEAKESTLPTDGVFVAIGHRPMTSFLKGQLELDGHGYIVNRTSVTANGVTAAQASLDGPLVTYPSMTSVEGVFAAGDGVDVRYRQAITAAGMGCMSAIDAERWLEMQESA
ncbi:FAD-dependent oxidoreductase [Candidatus Woesebacteria bacterium]|nr:FAD-dependent oxidoreductase [Candidatus Woesebacteria bacterium]